RRDARTLQHAQILSRSCERRLDRLSAETDGRARLSDDFAAQFHQRFFRARRLVPKTRFREADFRPGPCRRVAAEMRRTVPRALRRRSRPDDREAVARSEEADFLLLDDALDPCADRA